jgi:polar amino acid transport system substrate-binding protein
MRIVKFIFVLSIVFVSVYVGYDHMGDSIKSAYKYISREQTNNNAQKEIVNYLDDSKVHLETDYNPYIDYGKIFGRIADIVARGELVVCAKQDDHNQLFQMKTENGKYIGKDIDFAKQIAATLGVQLSYRMIYKTYDDVVDAVFNKEGDMGIAKISYTPERSRKVSYSAPYVISRKTLLINRIAFEKARQGNIQAMLNKKGATIGVTQDTCYEAFVKKMFPKSTMLLDPNWEERIIKPLEAGKITATMRDEVRVKLLLKSQPSLLVKLIPVIVEHETDSMAVVVNTECQELLLWLNKFIEVEQNADSVDTLIDRYWEYI